MNASLTSPWLRGAVAEVGDHRRVAVGVAGADDAVALHAHGVAGGVQGLRADHDRVEAEVVLARVPAALVDAAEQAEQLERVDAAAPGDAVLAVGREDVVLRAQRAAGADLRGLLAEQLGPDAELAVALERGGLDVDAPGQDHVAEEAADCSAARRRQAVAEGEVGVLDALALGGQQLDELGAAVLAGRVRRPPRGRGRSSQDRTTHSPHIRQRQSRDRRTPTLAQVVAGVCDPDHRMGSTYRPEPASTNLGGADRPGSDRGSRGRTTPASAAAVRGAASPTRRGRRGTICVGLMSRVHDVVVLLDLVEVDRRRRSPASGRGRGRSPTASGISVSLLPVALEVPVVDGVEARQRREQPDVGLGDRVAHQVAPVGEPVLEPVERGRTAGRTPRRRPPASRRSRSGRRRC